MKPSCQVVIAAALAAACGSGDEDAAPRSGEGGRAAAEVSQPDARDPCRLVSAAEMEALIGPLLEPPYRVNDNRRPDPRGEGCLYRARDHRNVTLSVTWEDGPLYFRMLAGMGGQIEELLGGRDPAAESVEAAWDQMGMAFGQIMAVKGDVAVQVDPLASRLDPQEGVTVLRTAMARLDAPLSYDGGRATRDRTAPERTPRDPCTLVTREEVEALMGPLRGAPRTSDDGSECLFPVDMDFFGEPLVRSLEVVWADGFYVLGQERQAMGMASRVMAAAMGPDGPPVGENVAEEAEPWDERITMLGGVVTVVVRDVLMRIAGDGFGGFDEDRALELLAKAAARIE